MIASTFDVNIRRSNKSDCEDIVNLFGENGNPHKWNISKWNHYYVDYPEGEVISFVAEANGEILGHYSLFPVLIGNANSYLAAHAYISERMRGLTVISGLMKAIDDHCKNEKIPFIVGFANPRFTFIKTKLFKWKVALWASFVQKEELDVDSYSDRKLRFCYSDQWLNWRFGNCRYPIVSRYRKSEGSSCYQLLYTDKCINAKEFDISKFECWAPEGYLSNEGNNFSQPFSIKVYNKEWSGPDLVDPRNWLIQMGDSDTFVYTEV